jgi:hypothetical protein
MVIVILLNTLIAMMSETLIKVQKEAFSFYAFNFGKTLEQARTSGVPVPLNLLAIPYHSSRLLFIVVTLPWRFKSLCDRARGLSAVAAAGSLSAVAAAGNAALGAASSTETGKALFGENCRIKLQFFSRARAHTPPKWSRSAPACSANISSRIPHALLLFLLR